MKDHDKPILLIEDSADDALLLERAIRAAGVENRIVTTDTGDDGVCYLKGEGNYTDREKFPLPGVVLVDMKLPGKTGFEILEWMRGRPELRGILVVAVTGYREIGQVQRAYDLGAATFLTKTVSREDVTNLIRGFQGYWALQPPSSGV